MNYQDQINEKNNAYMSLSKICYGYDIDPVWAQRKWLSEPTTLEFIQLWEQLHNLNFNKSKYIELCSKSLSVGNSPSIKTLLFKCKIKSIFFVDDNFKDLLLHKDLAIDFASWLSPSFRTFCLLALQKKWTENETNFKSEEDLIIGPKTLAQFTQKEALKNFKSLLSCLVYNNTI